VGEGMLQYLKPEHVVGWERLAHRRRLRWLIRQVICCRGPSIPKLPSYAFIAHGELVRAVIAIGLNLDRSAYGSVVEDEAVSLPHYKDF